MDNLDYSLIYDYWFKENDYSNWFSDNKDDEIKKNYSNYVLYLEDKNIEYLKKYKNKKYIMGIIICLDQFSRHLYRNRGRQYFSKNDNLCFLYITYLYSNNFYNLLDIKEKLFFLLPYRHQRKSYLLDKVIKEIQIIKEELIICDSKIKNLIRKYEIATICDYSKVTDTIEHINKKNKNINIYNQVNQLFDEYCIKNYTYKPIREYNINIERTKIYKICIDYINKYKTYNICISLSGGVDSMVLSYIYYHLLKNKKIKSLCAVHVDYGNRNISIKEALFIKNYCIYLGIPLITRRINHIKRSGTKILTENITRDIYESETKKIRFKLYEKAKELYSSDSIILGHHKDDLTENVLMNTIRGSNILELYTMNEYQIINNIPISRPLLIITKKYIYKLIHQ
jgi:tRNA(Ile)-lysidine synthetase-like protein